MGVVEDGESGNIDLASRTGVGGTEIPQGDLALARGDDATRLGDHVDTLDALLLAVDGDAGEGFAAGASGVEEAELAVVVACGDTCLPPVACLDVVGMDPLAKFLTTKSVPQHCCVVAGTSNDAGGVSVEGGAVDSTTVTFEGTNPVACFAVAEHGLSVVAGSDEPIGAVDNVGVVDVADGTGVSLANFDFESVRSG